MEKISLDGEYVKIKRYGESKKSCGGNQNWFRGTELDIIANQGCGMIAAIDVTNYLNNKKELSFDEYQEKAKDFLKQHPLAKLFLREFKRNDKTVFAIGILPNQISNYINQNTNNHSIYVWNGINGHRNMYEKMKDMLRMNIPVVWAIYNKTEKLNLYRYNEKNRKYEVTSSTNNHFVTAIAIYEHEIDAKLQRMVEVSSWGKSYYIDFDEYLEFVGDSIINKYCSNIIVRK